MDTEKELLDSVIQIVRQAGWAVMDIYDRDFAVEYKDDCSPLTDADKAAESVIEKGLSGLGLSYPVLSEESPLPGYAERKSWNKFWLVDPLDGTKEFIKKNGEFTVNIALIERGRPVLGVVYAPAADILYYGMDGFGAFREKAGRTERLPVAENKPEESGVLRVAVSRSHMNRETELFMHNLADQYPGCRIEQLAKGSSLKLCMVAEGSADIYPRFGPTMEWDTAAAHAVVNNAGKNVYILMTFDADYAIFSKDINIAELGYNKISVVNPDFAVL